MDLYTLREKRPDLFDSSVDKYQTTSARKLLLMNNPIPKLNIYWNAAIHTSTVHPQMVHDAKRAAGLSVKPVGYFEIPVSRLPEPIYYMPSYTLSNKLRIVWNVVCFRLGLTALLLQSEYEWLAI